MIEDFTLLELVESFGGAVLFATFYFIKNRRKKEQKFDLGKYAATLLLAVVVWGGAVAAGDTLTQGSLESQLLMYSGAIALLDAVLTAIFKGKPLAPAVTKNLTKLFNRQNQ